MTVRHVITGLDADGFSDATIAVSGIVEERLIGWACRRALAGDGNRVAYPAWPRRLQQQVDLVGLESDGGPAIGQPEIAVVSNSSQTSVLWVAG